MKNQRFEPKAPKSGVKLRTFWTGAILTASALVGGFAIVVWNRKALSRLRQPVERRKSSSPDPDDGEE